MYTHTTKFLAYLRYKSNKVLVEKMSVQLSYSHGENFALLA